jgi:hypothetical protein
MTQPPAAPPAGPTPSSATVTVPVVGTVKKRWVAYGALAVAAIVGWAYFKRSRQPSSVYNTATGTPDALPDGYNNPVPNGPPSGVQEDDPNVNTNDAEWSKKAVQSLVETGWDAQYVSIVIGKFLAGSPLTPEEVNVIRAAEALEGRPPSGIQIVAMPNAQPNPTPTPTPTPDPTPTNLPKRRYVIVQRFVGPPYPWDSYLDGIRNKFGRSLSNLTSWNGISNANLIYPNQKIYVDPPGSYSGEQRAN